MKKSIAFLFLLLSMVNLTFSQEQVKEDNNAENTENSEVEATKEIDTIFVIGSRNRNRVSTEAPVSVDVVKVEDVISASGATTVEKALRFAVPSFQTFEGPMGDLAQAVREPRLRGMSADQVLVLVNGKRRHASAYLNNGSFEKGVNAVDLSTIPLAAIERVEVLRDGAASQYGSDAIAGVMNIVLKRDADKAMVTTTWGQNAKGDGQKTRIASNLGFAIGEEGFVNFSLEYNDNKKTDRKGLYTGTVFPDDTQASDADAKLAALGMTRKDVTMNAGSPEVTALSAFFNMETALNEATLYAFGGLTSKQVIANSCFYRFPKQRERMIKLTEQTGYQPFMKAESRDKSIAVGIRGEIQGWELDLSNSFGATEFDNHMMNSAAATLWEGSQRDFYLGTQTYYQNVSSFDATQYFSTSGLFEGVNISAGVGLRSEGYEIIAGEEASYTDYYLQNIVVNNRVTSKKEKIIPTDIATIYDQRTKADPGCSCFRGFEPDTARSRYRDSMYAYLDTEFDMNDKWMIGAAYRYETYKEFEDVHSAKLATRYEVLDNLALRASYNNGFRAPSLAQINYNNISTTFDADGNSIFTKLVPNDSGIARQFGVPPLQPEKSNNYTYGLTFTPTAKFTATVDYFIISVTDRIYASNQLSPVEGTDVAQVFKLNTLSAAAFFLNGLDTTTKGYEVVLSYIDAVNLPVIGSAGLSLNLAYSKSDTTIDDIRVGSDKLKQDYGQNKENKVLGWYQEQYLTNSVPEDNISFLASVQKGKLTTHLGLNRVGSTWFANSWMGPEYIHYSDPAWITNLSFDYKLSKTYSINVGVDNLFDVENQKYDGTSTVDGTYDAAADYFGTFNYIPQFDTNGRHYYLTLTANF